MENFKRVALALVFMGFGATPSQAQELISGQYTGGSNFATTMTGLLYYEGNGIVSLDLTNQGPGVFAAVGLVNVPETWLVTAGDPTPQADGKDPWTWEATDQLTGDGLEPATWAWIAASPRPQHGLVVGDDELSFYFNLGADYTFAEVENIGFAVHSIAYVGCSTKFGVWNGGDANNDALAEDYDPTCVSVPEPSSTTLLAAGLMFLAVIVRRRRGAELVDENGHSI
jgi:hypothetical protein